MDCLVELRDLRTLLVVDSAINKRPNLSPIRNAKVGGIAVAARSCRSEALEYYFWIEWLVGWLVFIFRLVDGD